jgi:hypothetical protein
MKFTKILGLVAMAALALMAFASTASATTLEVGGVKQAGEIEIKAETASATLSDTSGSFANTCKSTVAGKDSTAQTGATVSGPISTLTFTGCTHEKVEVLKKGTLSVSWISGTTKGTVSSTGAEVKVPVTILGSVLTATCTTSSTDIGTLEGVKSGKATLKIEAVLECGSVLPSARWSGTYTVTSPEGLGVVE